MKCSLLGNIVHEVGGNVMEFRWWIMAFNHLLFPLPRNRSPELCQLLEAAGKLLLPPGTSIFLLICFCLFLFHGVSVIPQACLLVRFSYQMMTMDMNWPRTFNQRENHRSYKFQLHADISGFSSFEDTDRDLDNIINRLGGHLK